MIYYIIFILVIFILSYSYHRIQTFFEKYFMEKNKTQEDFISKKSDKFKDCNTIDNIYDRFYAEIYDDLFLSIYKNQYEILQLRDNVFNKWKDTKNKIKILDIGCGNGHHVDLLSQYKYNTIGIDISKNMINNAKKKYPLYTFMNDDFMNRELFEPLSLTHITCFFYTIYYVEDVALLFQNVNVWLKHNGVFCVHLVDKRKFDPVLEKASSLIPLYNPQKHEKKTHTSLIFNNFKYESDWNLDKHPSSFIEVFNFKDKSARRNYHNLYIFPMKKYVKIANDTGFKLIQTIDLSIVNHQHNYIFCFKKKYG
jgi:SAM-dependent methyltransferase